MSWVTAVENSESSGYISRDSPMRTTAMPLACSVVRFIQHTPRHAGSVARAEAPRRARRRTGCLSCSRLQLARQLETAAIDPRLHRALGQPEPVRDLLVRQLLQVAQHDRRPQRHRQRLRAPASAARAGPGARPPRTASARAMPAADRSCRLRARSSAAPCARCDNDRCTGCG